MGWVVGGEGLAAETHLVAEFPDGVVGLFGFVVEKFLLLAGFFGTLDVKFAGRSRYEAHQVVLGGV